MSTPAQVTLRELRRTRQRRRLGETDWYDVAYRVYLFALVGLTVVVFASDAIDGAIGDEVDTADLLTRGPSILGLFVVGAFALGLRSGADGGPVSVEVADIRHVLLAPIQRRMVLLRPVAQRLRAAAFALGLGAAVIGQLVATEVEGSRAAWAFSCGVFGAIVGATFVATAVIAHAIRLPRWAATLLGAVAIVWQGAVAWGIWTGDATGLARVGPANLDGRLALWGIDQRPIDLIPVIITLGMVGAALALCGKLRLEPLARRGELVSQLRFAATVQDLRTVVLLRRQLRSETLRTRPWGQRRRPVRPTPLPAPRLGTAGSRGATAGARPSVVWRRGVRSLRRLPLSRLVRITSLAILAGVGASLTATASPLFALLLLAAIFLLGLESLEPLSQEVDRPDLTDSLAIDRGWLFVNHLVAPAILLALAAMIGAVTATIIDPAAAPAAFALAIPIAWAGATGPIIATVLDAPKPLSAATTTLMGAPRDNESSLVPPEFAGFSTALRTFMPIVISAVGVIPVFAMRFSPDAGTAGRSVIGVGMFLAVVAWWVLRKDPWSEKIRTFFAEGRAAAST